MPDSAHERAGIVQVLESFVAATNRHDEDAREHILPSGYVVTSLPDRVVQSTLGESVTHGLTAKWTLNLIDSEPEVWIHQDIAAIWFRYQGLNPDGTELTRGTALYSLARTDEKWKICGISSTQWNPCDPNPPTNQHSNSDVMKPIDVLLNQFSTPSWDIMAEWFLSNSGSTLVRPPAPISIVSNKESIERLTGMVSKLPEGVKIQEKIFDVEVRVCKDIAFVWAPFEVDIGGKPHHDGANIFTLLKSGDRWVISGSLSYGKAKSP